MTCDIVLVGVGGQGVLTIGELLLHAAFDAGVNFYDTADVYGMGHSEELLGQAFAGKREQVVVASKLGNRTSPGGEWFKDFSKAWVLEAIDASLGRLNMDYLDLYQLHTATDLSLYKDETFEALEMLVDAGKIRYYGVSVGPAENGLAILRQRAGVSAIQVVYNMIARDPEEELLPLAQERGAGIIARVPLASGFLTGKFGPDVTFPPNDHRSRACPPDKARQIVATVGRLGFLTQGGQKTLAQAALQYCLSHPAVSTVIPGAKNPDQARDNAAASDGARLTEAELEQVRSRAPGDLTSYVSPRK